MKIIKLLILCILFSSCVKETSETKEYILFDSTELNVVEIDGCEYLYGDWGNATVLTHKGDCENKIHYESKIKTTL